MVKGGKRVSNHVKFCLAVKGNEVSGVTDMRDKRQTVVQTNILYLEIDIRND